MAAAGDKDRAFLLEPGGRILGVAPREDPVSRAPDDERRRREGSKFLQQHLALPSGVDMGAQGCQRRLEKARRPGQPVLLGQPRARGRPGAREEERRSSPGPLSDPKGVLHSAIAASPLPGRVRSERAGVISRPRPALPTRPSAPTRAGSESARRRQTRPPREFPTTAARSMPRASRKAARKEVKKEESW